MHSEGGDCHSVESRALSAEIGTFSLAYISRFLRLPYLSSLTEKLEKGIRNCAEC